MEQTLGKRRVRVDFNPSQFGIVNGVKVDCARLIDMMQENIPDDADGETKRLLALGHTAMEEAAMWYVKALTAEIN